MNILAIIISAEVSQQWMLLSYGQPNERWYTLSCILTKMPLFAVSQEHARGSLRSRHGRFNFKLSKRTWFSCCTRNLDSWRHISTQHLFMKALGWYIAHGGIQVQSRIMRKETGTRMVVSCLLRNRLTHYPDSMDPYVVTLTPAVPPSTIQRVLFREIWTNEAKTVHISQ